MLKSKDGHTKIMVGGEVSCVEEEEMYVDFSFFKLKLVYEFYCSIDEVSFLFFSFL